MHDQEWSKLTHEDAKILLLRSGLWLVLLCSHGHNRHPKMNKWVFLEVGSLQDDSMEEPVGNIGYKK